MQEGVAPGRGRRAVLLDAMGTLLALEEPAPRLRAALHARLGVDVGPDVAAAAIRAEISYYRARLHEGRDAASLAALRERCAAAMRPALGAVAAGAPAALLTAALIDAIAVTAYPDVAPALRALRAAGCTLVVVSNWDSSLHERLAEAGLAELVDGAVASAEVGAAKPARAIFARGLVLAGVDASDAWHVGDDVAADVEGALAAGIRPVLIDRERRAGQSLSRLRPVLVDREHKEGQSPFRLGGVPVLASLDGLPALIAGRAP